jgi:L-amino acid N-acyltransferase YncA
MSTGTPDAAAFVTRPASFTDAGAIAAIYNEGIANRVATFETEPRTAEQIAEWFRPGVLLMVAERAGEEIVAFAASFPYSARPCYAGIGEYSVYASRAERGRGAGRAALTAAAREARLYKLTSRIFPENRASRALMKRLGFAEIGVHRRHGKLDGEWHDCVVVERLIEENCR